MLYRLVIQTKDKLAKNIAQCLLDRVFYEDFFEFSRVETEAAEEVRLLDILEKKYHEDSRNRLIEEDKLSEVYSGGSYGDILIYCPDKEMALKEAEMLILWKKDCIPLFQIEDKLAKEKINSILESHKKLWSLKVFVSPTLKGKIENNSLNESLLREWCYGLVKVGEDKDKHIGCMVDLTILDILQNRGIISPEISKKVHEGVNNRLTELRERGGEEPIRRKHIENIIDEFIKEGMKE